jgi:hypothetical protein
LIFSSRLPSLKSATHSTLIEQYPGVDHHCPRRQPAASAIVVVEPDGPRLLRRAGGLREHGQERQGHGLTARAPPLIVINGALVLDEEEDGEGMAFFASNVGGVVLLKC